MVRALRHPDFSTAQFREALGSFATGVTVITARAPDGTHVGLTASSFNSVSLEPPLVLWSLSLRSSSLAALKSCTHYAVNILSDRQIELALKFASSKASRFDHIEFSEGLGGAALLSDCVASFECFNRSRYEEGDHLIFVGEVERCSHSNLKGLIYQNGAFLEPREP
jgi:flavin reductase (DIM6/NTAB) family NADH-FMN oxidoreductase RutF